jgi:hypothetical protein
MSANFNYYLSVTGDCSNTNSGAVKINVVPASGVPPFTFNWYYDSQYTNPFSPLNSSSRTGLSAGTYYVRATDSQNPTNQFLDINVNISSGLCLSFSTVSAATCGNANGVLTVTATTNISDVDFILYKGNAVFDAKSTDNSTYTFTDLGTGIYYISGWSAGCTATTETCIIEDSPSVSFGFSITDSSQCITSTGTISITGETGVSPFTYLWGDNGSTGSTRTGLSAGTYSVTVTDSNDCSLTQDATIGAVGVVGGVFSSIIQPSCLLSNGSATLTISGGTRPYQFSASNGTISSTTATSLTFTTLSPGTFSVNVTDAGLCTTTLSTTLVSPGSISSVSVIPTDSNCGSSDGTIKVSVDGGSPAYTYTLKLGSTTILSQVTNSTQYTFQNLSSGVYTVIFNDNSSCGYTGTTTISNNVSFGINISSTGDTCNSGVGQIYVEKTTGGLAPFNYALSNGQSLLGTYLTSTTFTNLVSGNYSVSVTDSTGCTISSGFTIGSDSGLNFTLYSQTCGETGSGGTVTALITQGLPPFTYTWSSNVSGTTTGGLTATGLTAGTYSLTISGSNGCTLTRSTDVSCSVLKASFQTYSICDSDMVVSVGQKRDMLSMVYEAYSALTSGNTYCVFNSSVFTAEISAGTTTSSSTFYTGYTLSQVPSDTLWYDTVSNLLDGFPDIASVNVDQNTGQIVVTSSSGVDTYFNKDLIINLIIDFDINCLT